MNIQTPRGPSETHPKAHVTWRRTRRLRSAHPNGLPTGQRWSCRAGMNHRRTVVAIVNRSAVPQTFQVSAQEMGTYVPQPSVDGALSLLAGAPRTTLRTGEQVTLTLTGRFNACPDDADIASRADWVSTNPGVATVQAGVVTAVAVGTTGVYARNSTVESGRVVFAVEEEPQARGCACAGDGPRVVWGRSGLMLLVCLVAAVRRRTYHRN
jgi:hypothetical protein